MKQNLIKGKIESASERTDSGRLNCPLTRGNRPAVMSMMDGRTEVIDNINKVASSGAADRGAPPRHAAESTQMELKITDGGERLYKGRTNSQGISRHINAIDTKKFQETILLQPSFPPADSPERNSVCHIKFISQLIPPPPYAGPLPLQPAPTLVYFFNKSSAS
ncbi:hypothetical protein EVAR_78_1 [Eumeta japonica]|uniref:Uncharacterized protein n=1 Tax=Eumeta variegata TaxID=151549 RepID=A0A4C1S887_EUMVA|nr:hypothetical protein EVAR_78_1 [Eumeta japonica]